MKRRLPVNFDPVSHERRHIKAPRIRYCLEEIIFNMILPCMLPQSQHNEGNERFLKRQTKQNDQKKRISSSIKLFQDTAKTIIVKLTHNDEDK